MKLKKYKKGGLLPVAIRKMKKKKSNKPSYGGTLNEVTVTAKAPTKSEKEGAKAFINNKGGSTDKIYAYSDKATKEGGSTYSENYEKAKELSKDTSKRLKVKKNKLRIGFGGKSLDGRELNKKLKKAGYKK